MGTYVDPGNQAFAEVAGKNYLDKTGLIRIINESIGTENKLTCFSRPRRFGKSWIANMLSAYYDCSSDDVLTLLIHLGYLTYDTVHHTARIPNEEVRLEFRNFLTRDDVGEHWPG